MCVCLCTCMHSFAHLLFKAFQVFSRFSREPQGGTALSCPAQLRGSCFLRVRGVLRPAAFLATPSSLCSTSPPYCTFFFASFLNCIWPCFDWRMSTSPRRIYKEKESAEGNESGVRNHQQETSGAPPPSPGS